MAHAESETPWDVECGLGGASNGLRGWTYENREVEPWEGSTPRVLPKGADKDRVARLRCLGNAVVPMCSFWVGMKAVDIIMKEKEDGVI